MPISCHFQDYEALLFVLTTCKLRYIKYPGFTFLPFYLHHWFFRPTATFPFIDCRYSLFSW